MLSSLHSVSTVLGPNVHSKVHLCFPGLIFSYNAQFIEKKQKYRPYKSYEHTVFTRTHTQIITQVHFTVYIYNYIVKSER